MRQLERIARTVECTLVGLLTLEIAALHLNVMRHAGPLWRDEISSLRVATMPTFSGFWSALVYDPVPALFFAILRLWNWLGSGASDQSFRCLGLLIGLGILGAIWFASWSMKKSPPTWALLLFGLSPVALVWGDSMRAYGLGCLFNILALAFFFKLLRPRPRPADIALATVTALLSVHSLFPNALLLFAASAGAIAVTIRRRWWRTTWTILAIGVTAALSLLPYAGIIRQTQSWSGLAKGGIDSWWIFTMMYRAVATGGEVAAALWLAGALVACVALFIALAGKRLFEKTEDDRDLVLYAGATFLISLGATVCFFRFVGWTTSVWYYLPLMATAAVCLDAISKIFRQGSIVIMANALVVVGAALVLSPLAHTATNVRLTNIDLTTMEIARRAQPSDLVVVDNYFYAVSFQRYYHGQAPWLAVPDVSDVSLHRWDLLTERMRQPKPNQALFQRIEQTLQSGHDVYVVGFAPLRHAPSAPPDLRPAPATTSDWNLWLYVRYWTAQVAFAAQAHAVHGAVIPVPCSQPVSVAENIHCYVVTGWKNDAVAAVP